MEKLDELVELTRKLYEQQENKRSRWAKLVHFGEKLLIPLMLGLLAYVANDASNKIAKSQLELSANELKLAQDMARLSDNRKRDELRLRNIEVLLKHPSSSDEERQAAMRLANYLDPDLVGIVESRKPADTTNKLNPPVPRTVKKTARNTTVARATGDSGRWQTYQACVQIPEGATLDKSSVRTRVVAGVGPGPWGDWAGPVQFSGSDVENPSKVCRAFAHQIHDQDRVLEISVDYEIPSPLPGN